MEEKEKEEMNPMELVSLTESSASEVDARLTYEDVIQCSMCHARQTKQVEEDVPLCVVSVPCACMSMEQKRCNECWRKTVENAGSLSCSLCGAPFTLELKAWRGKWNVRSVQWKMRLRGVLEVLFLLFFLHAMVIPLSLILWYFTREPWWLMLLASYGAVLTINGFLFYAYYAVQMCRHPPRCNCRSCAMGNRPLLTYPENCWYLYVFFLFGMPPIVWLFGIVIWAVFLEHRARQYYIRQCMKSFILRVVQ